MRRHILVTGASSGFGLATASHLASAGFDVTGLVPDGEGADALAERAGVDGVRVATVVADLSDPGQRAGLVEGMDLWGLVNNAGYMNAGQLRDVPVDDARRQIETMVLAPMDLTRQALPAMIGRGQGRVVNVTSGAVHTSTPLTGWYSACKAALRELTDALRLEVGPCGVFVTDVEPGGYRTGIWPGALDELRLRRAGSDRKDLYDRVLDKLQAGFALTGDPADVARAVGEVCSVGRPPAHVRVGPGAATMRVVDEVLPDRVRDRLVSLMAGLR